MISCRRFPTLVFTDFLCLKLKREVIWSSLGSEKMGCCWGNDWTWQRNQSICCNYQVPVTAWSLFLLSYWSLDALMRLCRVVMVYSTLHLQLLYMSQILRFVFPLQPQLNQFVGAFERSVQCFFLLSMIIVHTRLFFVFFVFFVGEISPKNEIKIWKNWK